MKNKSLSPAPEESPFISYAQNGEDILLWRALKQVEGGFYLDVGANDPIEHSVTKGFYDKGWTGINVEPGASHFRQLKEQRERDINLQVTVGSVEGSDNFFEFAGTGLSTTDQTLAAVHREKGWSDTSTQISRRTLESICAEFQPQEIHFLKIDVEGAELEVLRGADFTRFRPWIIVVEVTEPLSNEKTDGEIKPLLEAAGYQEAFFDGINSFYVSKEHPELLTHFDRPANPLDWCVSHTLLELHNSKEELKSLEAHSHNLLEQNRELRRRIASIESSLSWKVGFPLRAIDHLRRKLAQLARRASEKAKAPRREKQAALDLQNLRAELATKPLLSFLKTDDSKIEVGTHYFYPGCEAEGSYDRLISGLCKRDQLESPAFRYWLDALKLPFRIHRKQWEFAYVVQALYERDCLKPGTRGLGFAVGEESIPALMAAMGSSVLATDLDPGDHRAQAWAETAQLASSLEKLRRPEICPNEVFSQKVTYRHVDMNHIPPELTGFDFTWSSCSFEHCGSIELGLGFLENQMRCLKPGGVAVHTTEFNLTSNDDTIEAGMTVIFRKQDIEKIVERLRSQGHHVEPVSLALGKTEDDRHVDIFPYTNIPHLKLLLGDKYASTSIGLIIRKAI